MNQLNRISESEYEKLLAKLIIENLPLISTTIKFSNKEIRKLATKDLQRLNEFNYNSNIHYSFKEKFHCILDLIFQSEISGAKNLLNYIDEQLYKLRLNANIKVELRHKVISKIKEVILTEDIKLYDNNNPSFLNYFGEIMAINHILNYPNNRYSLEDIEYELTNKKCIDFSIYDNYYKDFVLVEIMNIHLQKEKLLSNNPNDFYTFLKKRIDDKYHEKTKLLVSNHVIKILPIIWTEVEDLFTFKSIFKHIDCGVYNFPLMFLLVQKDFEGTIQYQFTSINSYFENQ